MFIGGDLMTKKIEDAPSLLESFNLAVAKTATGKPIFKASDGD
jgi:hypothetical protein